MNNDSGIGYLNIRYGRLNSVSGWIYLNLRRHRLIAQNHQISNMNATLPENQSIMHLTNFDDEEDEE
jgi:hypothetical protein